jgi:hypothetical protein
MITTTTAARRTTAFSLYVLPGLLAAGLTGCATIVHGTTQTVPIISTPAGARVAIDSVPAGITPFIANLSRSRSHLVTLSRDSLPDVNILLTRRISGWIWGNMFLYYLPALIDVADGAAFKFAVDSVHVTLADWMAGSASGAVGSGRRIRFTPALTQSVVYAELDSSSAERLYIHGAFDAARRYDVRTVSLADLQRLEVATGHGRWAPWEAHRIGSPLLVDDQVRVRLIDSQRPIDGRLVTLDSSAVFISGVRAGTRLGRSRIAAIARPGGRDYAAGARRGAIIGAILGGIIGSQDRGSIVKPNGPNLMLGGAIGSVAGLIGAPIFAPKKWVDVRKW